MQSIIHFNFCFQLKFYCLFENVKRVYHYIVIDRSMYGEKAMKLPERTNENTGTYANGCVEVTKELGVGSVNLWSKMQETQGWQKKFLRLVKEIIILIKIKRYKAYFLLSEIYIVKKVCFLGTKSD